MNVVCSIANVPEDKQSEFLAQIEAAHSGLKDQRGFRWAMVLRSRSDPSRLAAVAMWLSLEDAGDADFPVQRYEVATARGSMTPAAAAALVDWRIESGVAPAFVNRWNAAYHAIEDRLGNRLLQDLDDSPHYVGLHVVTSAEDLTEGVLARATGEAAPEMAPSRVELFEVVSLSEA
jgi:heme-degrading monooxygenase HmoA